MGVPEFRLREDKLNPYLESLTSAYLFDELSPDFLEDYQLEFLKGVPLPFRPEDLVAFKKGGLNLADIADNVALVLGINTRFPYAEAYMRYLAKFFSDKVIDVFITKGMENLKKERFKTSCAYYRAALMLDSEKLMAMFGYACCCRQWYLSMEGEDDQDDLIRLLKAESTEYFEWTCIAHPEFAGSYYYLGFAYLNSALYAKAQFVWKKFVELSADQQSDEVKEIRERLDQLVDPVIIERGINQLTSGNIEAGLKILEPYADHPQFSKWWPLHYYLGSAYREMGALPEAIEGFRRVIQLNPSNPDANKALGELYEAAGEKVLAKKYLDKYQLLANDVADSREDAAESSRSAASGTPGRNGNKVS